MPKLIFTPEELKGYFKEKVRHHFYDDTVKLADALKVHSDGLFPEKLIKERRPHEPEEVLEYRQIIYEPITEPIFGRVLSSLSKIRRSSDWSIRYSEDDRFGKIVDEETLEEYCERSFPVFTSITNWVFDILLKKYSEDPNAVVFTFPKEINIEETEYLKPIPIIFDSCDVYNFVHEDYAVLRNPLGSTYFVRNKQQTGDSFYTVTTTHIRRYDQINGRGDIALTLDYEHQLGMLPVLKIPAIVKKAEGNNYLHKSRLSAMLPELNEAAREYSDLQAAKVLHIYPERFEYSQTECPTCKGTATIINPKWFEGCADSIPYKIDCDNKNCNHGYLATGPYSKTIIRPLNNATEGGSTSLPSEPIGFAKKDIEIVKVQDEGVDKHLYKALAAVNFQFLDQSPLNQSGTAKEVDKDELNNTVHAVAEDLVKVMDSVYKVIALTRYKTLYSPDDIEEFMLPKISVPEKYDILSATHLEQELTTAKTNKANPVILNALEVEYVSKKFNTDPSVGDELMLILKLDPLANISEDDKMTRLSNKGITQETYIISSNIHEFVQQAIDENPDFPELDLKEQKGKMKEYARAQIQAQDEAKKIVNAVTQDTGLDPVTGEPLPPTNGQMNPNEMVMDNATV